ncbi:MAG TPA: phosphocholine cytidylyltransferase family protein [Thermodesulfobacteriota bacterium]|nr:phosphocholine cytidylyltransferase family protein [Thermodesulfobacteriota bacterium]
MKALILSAGQGRRLLPLTAECPKCMLSVGGRSLIEWQIDALSAAGINRVSVVVGYRADQVERVLTQRYGAGRIKLIDNPQFAETDNLVSCWIAREEMNEDFFLLNGDTLFEIEVVRRVLSRAAHPVTVVTTYKPQYDADDMKVTLEGQRLVNIGKDLEPEKTDGESVGMILFRGEGPSLFRQGLEKAMGDPSSSRKWYLSVIRDLCPTMKVWTCSIEGLRSCEVDYPADLKSAEHMVSACACTEESVAKCG